MNLVNPPVGAWFAQWSTVNRDRDKAMLFAHVAEIYLLNPCFSNTFLCTIAKPNRPKLCTLHNTIAHVIQ